MIGATNRFRVSEHSQFRPIERTISWETQRFRFPIWYKLIDSEAFPFKHDDLWVQHEQIFNKRKQKYQTIFLVCWKRKEQIFWRQKITACHYVRWKLRFINFQPSYQILWCQLKIPSLLCFQIWHHSLRLQLGWKIGNSGVKKTKQKKFTPEDSYVRRAIGTIKIVVVVLLLIKVRKSSETKTSASSAKHSIQNFQKSFLWASCERNMALGPSFAISFPKDLVPLLRFNFKAMRNSGNLFYCGCTR